MHVLFTDSGWQMRRTAMLSGACPMRLRRAGDVIAATLACSQALQVSQISELV